MISDNASASAGSVFPLLGTLRKRERLWVASTGMDDDDLEQLKPIGVLKSLDMSRNFLADDGLRHLEGFRDLNWLRIGNNVKVTGPGLKHLRFFKSLEFLDLGGTRINDESLVHLEGMSKLAGLWLTNTKTTDAGLVHLQGSAKLARLSLSEHLLSLRDTGSRTGATPISRLLSSAPPAGRRIHGGAGG